LTLQRFELALNSRRSHEKSMARALVRSTTTLSW